MKMKFFIIVFVLSCDRIVQSGYIYDKGLGTDCLYDEDCVTRNSFCKGNKICACKIGYQYDPGSDVCFPKEVDLKCNEDYDCSALANTECRYDRCQCKYDHVPSRDKSMCLPTMRLTSDCQEDIQCNSVMNKSYCDPTIRHCVCEKGLRQDATRMLCVEKPKLHDPCQTTEDCDKNEELKGKVQCYNLLYRCECAEGYTERNNNCYKGSSSQAKLTIFTSVLFLLVKFIS